LDERAADGAHDVVEELMAEVLERPSEAWAEALRAACEAHPLEAAELRARMALLPRFEPPSLAPSPPERLGPFRILERLGGGGMGIVFRAEQEGLARQVAVKVIRPEYLGSDGARARFQRETEAIARLAHPGIIPIYTVGEEGGVPYFAMQLLRGATLADVLRSTWGRAPDGLGGRDLLEAVVGHRSPPSELDELFRGGWVEACVSIAAQLARALHHAHERGILHRDVKPSNVVLEPDGRAVLLDFGLTAPSASGASPSLTRTGTPLGTLAYMSPEQQSGSSEVDGRTDVYSVGVTLYELLTLQLPYPATNPVALHESLQRATPDSIRARNRRVPEEVETVCLTAMAVRPAERYASARALAEDLENALARRPIRARPPGALRRARRWAERHPGRAATVGFGTLALVGIPLSMLAVERANARAVQEALGRERSAAALASEARAAAERALAAEREALGRARAAQAAAESSLARAGERESEARDVLAWVFGMFERAAGGQGGGARPDLPSLLEAGAAHLTSELGEHGYVRARVQLTLARCYETVGLFERAREHFDGVLALLETLGPGLDPYLWAYALFYSGGNRISLAQHEAAVADLERALRAAEEAPPAGDAALAPFLRKLGEALTGGGRAGEALAVRERLVGYLEEVAPEARAALAKARADLGFARVQAGQRVAGERALEAAVEELRATVDPLDEDLIQAVLRAASIPLGRGDFARAEALYREGADKARERWGPDHAFVLGAQAALADLCVRRGDLDGAARLYEELLPRLGAFPAHHPLVAGARYGYSLTFERAGKLRELVPLLEDGSWLAAFRAAYGPDDPYRAAVIRRAAGAYYEAGRLGRALELMEEYGALLARSEGAREERLTILLSTADLRRRVSGDARGAREDAQQALELLGQEDLTLHLAPSGPPADVRLAILQLLAELAEEEGLADAPERRALAEARRHALSGN